ncbi:hypothetical protein ANMWB30_23010 [Arthrobacter sp. MWB30]|nr:hypothetical protein ANMWB30_23010 [Arthrobacter sp. MWB30]
MSNTAKVNKSTNGEALTQTAAALMRVTSLMRRVLVKFPFETLPPELSVFVQFPHTQSLLFTSTGSEFTLTFPHTSGVTKLTKLIIPVSLLDAPEAGITRWIRDQYWTGVRLANQSARIEAANEVQRLERACTANETRFRQTRERLEADLHDAQARLARHSTPLANKHRKRAADSADRQRRTTT